MIKVENIVGILDFHREVDLDAVSDLLESADTVSEVTYAPEENHWLQSRFRLNNETKYVSFYRSGKCAIVGCDSIEQLEQLVDIVKESMDPIIIRNTTFEIANIVCVGDLYREINLEHLAIAAGLERVEYEPEQFPGLIYRNEDSPAVLLVFASGKVVITGIKTIDVANKSFCTFMKKVKEWNI